MAKKPSKVNQVIAAALKKPNGSKRNKKNFRLLPQPVDRQKKKIGGFLPILLSALPALTALGSVAAGGAAVAKAVNSAKAAKKQLSELKRHNEKMEAIALGKGIYLRPYKNGSGLVLEKKKNMKKSKN